MRFTYKTSEELNNRGARFFGVDIRVELEPDELSVCSSYGVYTRMSDIPARFGENLSFQLSDFANGYHATFRTLQLASDFPLVILEGVREIKEQIDAVGAAAAELGVEQAVEL